MLKLSFVIVNFNSRDYLTNCIQSIYQSSLFPKDYEIIIIDNNSNDDSLTRLESIKKDNLFILKNNDNLGFSKANNQGIKKTTGEYVLLLNPDTILEKDTLERVLSYMDKDKNVAVTTPRIELPDGTIDDACHRGFPTPVNALFYFTGLANIFPHSTFFNGYHLGYQNMDKTHEIDSCVGAFMMVRRNIGEEIGWLDEDYFWYGEDLDFCYRVKQAGYKVVFLPSAKITHFKGISSGIKNHSQSLSTASADTKKLTTQKRFEVMRLFYKKHYLSKYPKLLTDLVFLGINIKEKLSSRINL